MIALGVYERLALEVLRDDSMGPWKAIDVERLAAKTACVVVDRPGAQSWGEVRDWLTSLSRIDREELAERFNESRNRCRAGSVSS